jgi:splicing factor 3A subunit 2
MDFQHRPGSKPGSGGVAGYQESNIDRRERLRRLALETIDLAKDPYFMKNHLGSYECKLCLTLHTNEGSYLAHTQGRKHQTNLARRAAKENKTFEEHTAAFYHPQPIVPVKKDIIKIGRPGYKVTKVRDPLIGQFGLLFQIQYPEIGQDVIPRYRFMSAYEQHRETPNKAHQYLLFAAEPYETVAFKIQSKEIDRNEERFWTHWDPDLKQFTLQFFFKRDRDLD